MLGPSLKVCYCIYYRAHYLISNSVLYYMIVSWHMNHFSWLNLCWHFIFNSIYLIKVSSSSVLPSTQILSLGALEELMKMVKSGSTEEVIKALYAVSALIRNNIVGQELFFSENGDLVLQVI